MTTQPQDLLEAPTALAPAAEKGTELEAEQEQQPTSPQEAQPSSIEMAMQAPGLDPLGEIIDPTVETTSESFYKTIRDNRATGMAMGGGMLPVEGNITSPFGSLSNRGVSGNPHNGMDIGVPIGTPVKAPLGGTVRWSKWAGAYGNAVLLEMDDGTYHLLGHLSRSNVRSGQRVEAGQVIALSGNTGRSTGPHVHWEVRSSPAYASAFNPQDWLRSAPQASSGGSNNLGATNQWTARAGDARAVTQNAYKLMRSIGASHQEARLLASVVMPESGGNPTIVNRTSVNGSNATGLWQIMFPLHRGRAGVQTRSQLYNPLNNARVALSIYRDQGLGAWEVTRLNGGRHRQYLQYV